MCVRERAITEYCFRCVPFVLAGINAVAISCAWQLSRESRVLQMCIRSWHRGLYTARGSRLERCPKYDVLVGRFFLNWGRQIVLAALCAQTLI